ncbi:cutinase family protein [Nocardia cyriacigeorgica]|uniref:Cutinase family protein n=1 Tax=Nocardia cyriacigeorgica TaxID=135487 RepID=A0A6P1CZG5_9NOCA|nr:cutinase family protein [Nocardia cyriacigeorgica]NEW38491.1 cutinase family protein [Nocardia cyriacigeorgica]NEW43545.1 cutinase family protein [Nocardia cyriacigeorgica]NEW49519.1 cutinase family protein [Nocardia cyriacigeorgica]NEW54077.1 cutinase family protein [Nocardia cyriacigeorgica]
MALREFLARHRMASAVAAPAVLGVAAAVAATFALTSTPEKVDTQLVASVTECRDMVTISVAGRNDTPREGTTAMLVDANGNPLPAALSGDHSSEWLDPVVNAPRDDVAEGSYAAVYIAYPANMSSYEDAVNAGVANAKQVMSEIAAACPDTKFSIVGYSEGADVVRRVAMEVGHQEPGVGGEYGIVDPENVVGVVILADPGRSKGDGPFPGSQDPHSNPDGFDQDYQNGQKPVPGQGALPGTSGDFGALNGKIASFCSDGDLTCSAPDNISLLNLAVNVGRQLNVDDLEREGLTPATGQDVAVVLGRIAMTAFADIASQPNWMASDETFLEVLLRVSDPAYKPGEAPKEQPKADAIAADQMSPLAYLPQKILNEIVGLIVTNQNTIPVILSDPYKQTLGPNHTGHHFDYWDDADPDNGRPMTSAEYAAAWITHLAKQAQAGEKVDTNSKPTEADLAAAYKAAESTTSAAPTTEPAEDTTTTSAPTTTTKPKDEADPSTTAPTTTAPTTTRSTEAAATPEVTTTPAAPTTTTAPAETTESTTTAPSTTTTTTKPAAPTTDARAEANN